MTNEQGKARAMRTGWIVIVLLAVLTAIEYVISLMTGGNWLPLAVIILIKTGLIVQYFMHLPRVLSPEQQGGGH